MTKLYRSLIFVPGNNPRFLEKAKSLPADIVCFDLEDSVPDKKGQKSDKKSPKRKKKILTSSIRSNKLSYFRQDSSRPSRNSSEWNRWNSYSKS